MTPVQVRFSHCIGLPVVREDTLEQLGLVSGILIDPDKGKIEGFFLTVEHFMHKEQRFLSILDILRWSKRVYVRDEEALSPPEDLIRLQPLLHEPRTILGQPIRTESGDSVGTCKDVQFTTNHFLVDWIFPRGWFRWGTPISAHDIVEVRKDAIIIRDMSVPEKPAEEPATSLIPPMPEAA